ncbi:MAG: sigma-70 family RNA polymerase sigma factor [Gemmatimonadaceae bacterium]|nr:sigma-70 family RNA polymerase sigma factor [Gemmatimonadaceae bacterium]
METWRAALVAGDSAGAWNLFIATYRRLIVAVIRRTIADEDDVDDVFGDVCADLSADELARLVRHTDSGTASFSTWLATVVHNRTIDWVRHRDGRRRVTAPTGLTTIQQKIFDRLIREQCSHVEAYELMRQQLGPGLSFGAFMKEVTTTFGILQRTSGTKAAHYWPGPPLPFGQTDDDADDALVLSESAARLAAALELLPPDERLAVQLFIVDELPAAAVARAVGWPNAKAVYNRVYRALGVLRSELERLGLERNSD